MRLTFSLVCGLVATAAAAGSAGTAAAAAPDGQGPWADAVTSIQQGETSTGNTIEAVRRDAGSALGVAENGYADGTFISLGIGGRIALRFDNAVCNGPGADLAVAEATKEPYPAELVDVYASADGTTLVPVATHVNKDVALELPASLSSVRFVVLVDATDPELFRAADGYDLDGVAALHTTGCTPAPLPPAPEPGSTGTSGVSPTSASTSGGRGGEALLQRAAGAKQATCVVPRMTVLRRHTLTAVRKALTKSRCSSLRKVRRRYSSIKAGRVTETLPKSGSRRPYRTKVTIVVSRGPRPG